MGWRTNAVTSWFTQFIVGKELWCPSVPYRPSWGLLSLTGVSIWDRWCRCWCTNLSRCLLCAITVYLVWCANLIQWAINIYLYYLLLPGVTVHSIISLFDFSLDFIFISLSLYCGWELYWWGAISIIIIIIACCCYYWCFFFLWWFNSFKWDLKW